MKKELLKLSKMILKLAQIPTDKATLIAESDLVEGIEVFIESEDGELIPAESGIYESETSIIEVESGKVISIKEKDIKEEEDVKPEELEEQPIEDEKPEEPEVNELDELKAKIAEYEAAIERMKAELIAKDEKIAELEAIIEEKERKAEEEFNEQKPAFKETSEQMESHKNLAEIAREMYK